jgi:hypothetical protein
MAIRTRSGQFMSRTAHREPSQAHRSPWFVQTKVSTAYVHPGPWPSKIIARPPHGHSQTKPNLPQPSPSPDNVQTSQYLDLSKPAHVQLGPWTEQPMTSRQAPCQTSPWPAQPISKPSYCQHSRFQHQTTFIRGHGQAIPRTGQAISRSDHGMASSAHCQPSSWPNQPMVSRA